MKLESEFDSGILRFYFIGELDHHAAGDVVRSVEKAIERYMPRSCVVDFTGVTFMDSSGIAVLLKTARRMSGCGGGTHVVGASPRIIRVLNTAGINKIIEIQAQEVHTA